MGIWVTGEQHYWLDKRWKQYVRGPDAGEEFDASCKTLPNESAVYFLWSADDRLLYIGQSVILASRVIQHRRTKQFPFAYLTYIPVEPDLLGIIETVYIHALKPRGNTKLAPVNWRGHTRMERLVRRIWRVAKEA